MARECPFERRVKQETYDIVVGKLRRIRRHARLNDSCSMSNSYETLKALMKDLDNLIEDLEEGSDQDGLEISK